MPRDDLDNRYRSRQRRRDRSSSSSSDSDHKPRRRRHDSPAAKKSRSSHHYRHRSRSSSRRKRSSSPRRRRSKSASPRRRRSSSRRRRSTSRKRDKRSPPTHRRRHRSSSSTSSSSSGGRESKKSGSSSTSDKSASSPKNNTTDVGQAKMKLKETIRKLESSVGSTSPMEPPEEPPRPVSIGEQLHRIQALDEINAPSFVQHSFLSRGSKDPPPTKVPLVVDKIPKPLPPSDWKLEEIPHPRLFEESGSKWKRWKEKLDALRRKVTNGTIFLPC